MKANQFVKKFGIREAKIALMYCKSTLCGTVFYKNIQVDLEDLKRMVESYDLVNNATPEEIYQAEICEGIWCDHRLVQALEDVDNCM